MHAMYAFPIMVPAQHQPQVALNYNWANPFAHWTEPEPADMLQQLGNSSAYDHAGSGSEPTHGDGEAKVSGLLVSQNPSQNNQRDDQDIPDDRDPLPGCGHEFAEVSTKILADWPT